MNCPVVLLVEARAVVDILASKTGLARARTNSAHSVHNGFHASCHSGEDTECCLIRRPEAGDPKDKKTQSRVV